MRLIRRVESLQSKRTAVAATGAASSIAWTSGDQSHVPEGYEGRVAVDSYDLGMCDGIQRWRTVERVPEGRGDRGLVYGAAGVVIGRVLRVRGSVVTYELGAVDAAPAARKSTGAGRA